MTSADEPDLTAAELALGVLDGGERAAALRRVLADPAFAREVERWRRRFASLYPDYAEVEPNRAVERRVAAIPDGRRTGTRGWRLVASLTGIAAAAALAILSLRPARPPMNPGPAVRHEPLLIAVFRPSHAEPFAAVYDPARREVKVHGGIVVAAGHDAELWAIGADGVPHAAGLLGRGDGPPLAVRRGVALAVGTTLAVSIEQAGGSPAPTPAGPVVATGKLGLI